MEERQQLFNNASIPKALASLAVPTVISQLIIMVYNLADTFFIGRTNDPYKIAAASLAYVLFFLLNAIANLFGIGGGSLVSRLLGKQKAAEADAVCSLSFYGTLLITALYCCVCLLFIHPILRFLGASEHTILYAEQYTFWCVVIGGLPAAVSMTAAHLLRSAGYGKEAGIGLSMGSLVNIVLDPLFMFVFLKKGNEVTGAAIATMLSNVLSLLYYIIIMVRKRDQAGICLNLRRTVTGLQHISEILMVGFPSAISTFLVCISIMLCNSLASLYGDIPVAAVGIVKKLEMLPHNVGTGLCQGMIPLVAYNFASGNLKRMKKTIQLTRAVGLVFTAVCIIIFELFAFPITRLFIREQETVLTTVQFLRIMILATPLTICNFHFTYTLQAMGKGKQSMLLSICRQGLFNIPVLFLMNHIFGLYGVIWTQFIADTLTLLFSVFVFRKTISRS